jgi:TetR/AcrR family transcriptional regulator, ethionamide resistance regulator
VGERIEQALVRLLGHGEGFATLSVGQLLTEAGVARSTFYAYFGDKLAVLLVVGRRVLEEVAADGDDWATLPDAADRSDLRSAVGRLVHRYRDNAVVLGALAESAAADRRAREAMRAALAGPRAAVFEHTRAQQQRGAIRAEVDVEVTVAWLLAMVDTGLYRFVRRARPDEVDAQIEVMTDLIWQSLYEGAPRRLR